MDSRSTWWRRSLNETGSGPPRTGRPTGSAWERPPVARAKMLLLPAVSDQSRLPLPARSHLSNPALFMNPSELQAGVKQALEKLRTLAQSDPQVEPLLEQVGRMQAGYQELLDQRDSLIAEQKSLIEQLKQDPIDKDLPRVKIEAPENLLPPRGIAELLVKVERDVVSLLQAVNDIPKRATRSFQCVRIKMQNDFLRLLIDVLSAQGGSRLCWHEFLFG